MNGPWDIETALEYVYPTEVIACCTRCRKLHFIQRRDLEAACGADFTSGRWCTGQMVQIVNPPQEVLMAALKLGGEQAVHALLDAR